LLVLAVENNIVNVFRKPDLWQDINESIPLFFSAKINTFEVQMCKYSKLNLDTFERSAAAQ